MRLPTHAEAGARAARFGAAAAGGVRDALPDDGRDRQWEPRRRQGLAARPPSFERGRPGKYIVRKKVTGDWLLP